MFLDDFANFVDLRRIQAIIFRDGNLGLKPEFHFSVPAGNMDVLPGFFPRKEEKTITLIA
jgi:hypothetical protein